MQIRLFGDTRYFTKAQLEETSPTRRDGVTAHDEARWRANTSNIVTKALKRLKLPDWTYQTAMHYINRFYLTRSISKNDRHLVVGGAVLLASKVQESPRSVQDVAYVLLQLKNAKKQPNAHIDQASLEQFKEGVVVVEQAILFAINFNLNVGVETHATLAKRLLESLDLWVTTANPPPEEAEAHEIKLKLFQFTVIFLNDSVKTTLCLQFPPSQLAMVALTMAAKRYASAKYGGTNLPPILELVVALASDAGWFGSQGLTLEQAAEIETQFSELYGTAPTAQQQQQAPAGTQPAAKPEAAAQRAATAPAQAADVEEGEVAVTNVAADGGVLLPPPEPLSAPAESGQAQQAVTMSCDAPGEGSQAQQQCQQPRRSPHHIRRNSDLEAAVPGEQHATSSLQAAPEMPDADAAAPTCGHGNSHADARLEDSANENFSPNGLTGGNASGSGCAQADGQPEVCSTGHERVACGAAHRLAGGKRRFCEEEGLGGATTNDPQSVTPGRSPGKVRRLEDSGEHVAVA